MGCAAADAAALLAIKGAKGTKPLVFLRMMNKKSEQGSQKPAAAEAANLLETTGPSGIKPSGTLRICLELREEENELKIAGLSIVEAEENEDAKFARLLQEYWKSMKQKKSRGSSWFIIGVSTSQSQGVLLLAIWALSNSTIPRHWCLSTTAM